MSAIIRVQRSGDGQLPLRRFVGTSVVSHRTISQAITPRKLVIFGWTAA